MSDSTNVSTGSVWYDGYNFGDGSSEHARVVRVEPDTDPSDTHVRIRVVGGSKVSPQALGRVTRARLDRFNKAGGYRPATQVTHDHIAVKFKQPYMDKNYSAKKKPNG